MIFGLVGIPVVQVAEEALRLGIRFVAFRNEQAASYAATAYGYLTGRPGVCLVVGGPGVLHAMSGIGNSSINHWPMLLLAGSCESHLVGRGAFQELDAVSLLSPHTKKALRSTCSSVSRSITDAYRAAWYGRGGTGFVDLPADVIQGVQEAGNSTTAIVTEVPRAASTTQNIMLIADLIKNAKAPLVVVGKGAAYGRAEAAVRELINGSMVPCLPTPMGKGVIADSHPLNVASARSAALRGADVVLLLGARLNWILHFGGEPKWSSTTKFVQVDISADEIGSNGAEFGIVGDLQTIILQLCSALRGWTYDPTSPYLASMRTSKERNELTAARMSKTDGIPMTYHRSFDIIKSTLNKLSPPHDGNIVYVSEGANSMDISRSAFAVEHPRLRLDAGTHATMGVGLGYAIAAHCAYNFPEPEGESGPFSKRKKVVCIEGDSAFGFSMAEVETMARYKMDILIFVMNNGGIYRGDSGDADEWLEKQQNSVKGEANGLRSTALGWEVGYEKIAEMCGGLGFLVRTPEELQKATETSFLSDAPAIVNIVIESGHEKKLVCDTGY